MDLGINTALDSPSVTDASSGVVISSANGEFVGDISPEAKRDTAEPGRRKFDL